MITPELIRELPPNHSRARRLLTWTWPGYAGQIAPIEALFQRWSIQNPGKIHAYHFGGQSLGVLQVSCLVEFQTAFKVSMKAREMSEIMARRFGYPGAMPTIESVRIRHGGNLRRTDGPAVQHSDLSGQP